MFSAAEALRLDGSDYGAKKKQRRALGSPLRRTGKTKRSLLEAHLHAHIEATPEDVVEPRLRLTCAGARMRISRGPAAREDGHRVEEVVDAVAELRALAD